MSQSGTARRRGRQPGSRDVMKYLIVNGDDFGASSGVNRGIKEAHLHGILTSASLLVNTPWADEAARLAAGLPNLRDRKSTRLNSSHQIISYAVFCLKKKKKTTTITRGSSAS